MTSTKRRPAVGGEAVGQVSDLAADTGIKSSGGRDGNPAKEGPGEGNKRDTKKQYFALDIMFCHGLS